MIGPVTDAIKRSRSAALDLFFVPPILDLGPKEDCGHVPMGMDRESYVCN